MEQGVRIDKWLWAVRIFKTRSIAAEACKANRISINGQLVKPSREVNEGDKVEVKKMPVIYTYVVDKCIKSRVGAPLAAQAARDITPQDELDKLNQNITIFVKRDRGTGRPTKKERRDIDDMMDNIISEDF